MLQVNEYREYSGEESIELTTTVILQRQNTFAIYTNNNAYLLQASDFEEMKDWISKIDQFYPVDKLITLATTPTKETLKK